VECQLSSRSTRGAEGRFREGGDHFECTLFGAIITKLSKQQIYFLQDEENWHDPLKTFKRNLAEKGMAEPVEVVEYGSRTQMVFSFDRNSHLDS